MTAPEVKFLTCEFCGQAAFLRVRCQCRDLFFIAREEHQKKFSEEAAFDPKRYQNAEHICLVAETIAQKIFREELYDIGQEAEFYVGLRRRYEQEYTFFRVEVTPPDCDPIFDASPIDDPRRKPERGINK